MCWSSHAQTSWLGGPISYIGFRRDFSTPSASYSQTISATTSLPPSLSHMECLANERIKPSVTLCKTLLVDRYFMNHLHGFPDTNAPMLVPWKLCLVAEHRRHFLCMYFCFSSNKLSKWPKINSHLIMLHTGELSFLGEKSYSRADWGWTEIVQS